MRRSSARKPVRLRLHHRFEGVAAKRALLLQVQAYFLHLFGWDGLIENFLPGGFPFLSGGAQALPRGVFAEF